MVFENVISKNLINQAVIKNGDDVKVFFIYEQDTKGYYIDTYKFSINDKNLNTIEENEISVSLISL